MSPQELFVDTLKAAGIGAVLIDGKRLAPQDAARSPLSHLFAHQTNAAALLAFGKSALPVLVRRTDKGSELILSASLPVLPADAQALCRLAALDGVLSCIDCSHDYDCGPAFRFFEARISRLRPGQVLDPRQDAADMALGLLSLPPASLDPASSVALSAASSTMPSKPGAYHAPEAL